MEFEIEFFITSSGRNPFDEWFESVRETHTKSKILARLARLKLGNFGDCKSLGDEIADLRIHYDPGIRIYYSKRGQKVILLLCGGYKGSQSRDIDQAKEYLKEYQSRKKKHGKK